MAKTETFLLLCFLPTFILVLNKALVNSNDLAIKLIHPYSQESPFFPRNLSSEERIKSLVSQSNSRGNYLAKTSSSSMQTQIKTQAFHYTVKVGIGTFGSKPPYKEYYLEMDTGSSIVWMQCDGCTKCFKQTPKPFPRQNSSSFRPILDPDDNKTTYYTCKYQDGSITRGISAQETFYLTTKSGGLELLEDVNFGCGLENNMQFGKYKNNKIAGIMGLGWNDLSFIKQIGPQFKGVFSYCLPVVSNKTPSTYLRFGADILTDMQNSKSTTLYRKNRDTAYYVDLQGISVNNMRLNISPLVFVLKNDVRSGCMIDSGTPYSRLVSPAFDVLKMKLEKYFSGLKKVKGDLGLELCYERSKPGKYNNLPSVTLHLRGADLVMKAEAVFEVVGRSIMRREYFCLAMVRDSGVSVIGSHQQTNHMIVHDTTNERLVFSPVDCSKNP